MKLCPVRLAALILAFAAGAATAAFAQTGDEKRPQVALVLSGGSAWGLAHIGVIKVMEEIGVPVDIVVGTSMGSIVGGFYAMGYDAAELEKIMTGTDWIDLFAEESVGDNESFSGKAERARYAASIDFDKQGLELRTGLLDGNKILRFVDSLVLSVPSPVDFDALQRRFRAVATDVSTGEAVVLSRGSLADTMRASMSLPGIFSPYLLDGRYFVDGCMSDNLPIDLAREMGADIVIAVDLFDGSPFDPENGNLTPVDALLRSFDILVRTNVTRQLARADLVIPVDVRGFLPSDFGKGPAIGLRGEETARKHADGLARIRDRTGTPPPASNDAGTTPGRPAALPVESIVIRGVGGRDLESARKIFAPLEGTVPTVSDFQGRFRELDRKGSYESVRIRRDFSADGRPLVVDLVRKKKELNELRLHFLYEATFSTALTGNFNFVPALLYRGLTTEDSRLLVDLELLDAPGADIRFIQPFGGFFSATPFFSWRQDFTTRLTETSVGYQYRTVLLSTGILFSVQPFSGIEWSAGWSFDRIDSDALDEFEADTAVTGASLVHARFSIQRLDSPVFPASGMAAAVRFVYSSTALGSEREFRTLETAGSTFLSPGLPFSAGLVLKAGTDFSGGTDDTGTAPPFYKPDLADRRLFPGPLRIDERIGSHVAGAGLELKHNLNWHGAGMKFPVFFLMNASIGAVLQDPRTIGWFDEVFHWNATAGVGLRVSDAFGIALRAGIQQNTVGEFTPFIAFDLGAVGY